MPASRVCGINLETSFPRQRTEAFHFNDIGKELFPKKRIRTFPIQRTFSWTDKTQPFKKVFSIQSAKDSLRGWLKEIWTVPNLQFGGDSSIQRNGSWGPATETVTATATVKNQKTSLWFMCYRSVQWIIVAQSSKGPIKRSVKQRRVTQATRDNILRVALERLLKYAALFAHRLLKFIRATDSEFAFTMTQINYAGQCPSLK
jgi:hypothetical protein